jgi:hypothetical protein
MKRPEQALQRNVVKMLDTILPQPSHFHHVPNGGGRSKIEAAILKGQGVKRGVPDLMIFAPGAVVAIEMKSEGGRTSPDQKAVMEKLRQCGVHTAVCRSVDDVLETLAEAGIEVRAT